MADREMSMGEAINLALDEALSADPRVFLLGEDIADPAGGIVGITKGLSTKHGDARVRDTPISEAAIVGAAVGAGLGGLRPVAEIMIMDFIGIAADQIINHAAKLRYMTAGRTCSPITIRTMVIGGMNMGMGATHSQSLEAWFMHIPGLKVVMPAMPADAKGLLTTAIFDEDPVLFVESAALYGRKGPVPSGDFRIPLGKANLVREGSDVTIVTYGLGVHESLSAGSALAEESISAEIVDLRTLVPMDIATVIESVSKTRRAVVVHFATRFGGPGAEIASTINESLFGELLAPVGRLGATYTPIPSSTALVSSVYPHAQDIAEAVRHTMQATPIPPRAR